MIGGVERTWRRLATGICFVVFGAGGLVLTLVAFPLIRLFVHPAAKRKDWGQRLIGGGFALFCRIMCATGVLTYSVQGREKLNRPGCVVVANHPCLIDVVLLIAHMPRADCIVKESLLNHPLTGAPLRLAGYIGNSGGLKLVEQCSASLAAGNRLLIFPEGTRTRPGQPLSLQRGAANIAVHAEADVVPVTIVLSETTLTKLHRWYQVPRKRLHVSVSVDDPMPIQPFLDAYASKALAARKLTEYLRGYYQRRLSEADRLPEEQQIAPATG